MSSPWRRAGKILSNAYDKTVRVWDPATGACMNVIRSPTVWWSIAGTPGGGYVTGAYATGETDTNEVAIWE